MDHFSVSEFPTRRLKRLKRLSDCTHHRDWPWLPRNILLCIMDKLTVVDDYVRFGAVCRPWRTIFAQESRPPCSRLPFLLIAPEEEDGHQHMALYSLSRQRVYDFRLQLPHNKVCRGSSFGWLVTLETKARHRCLIQLQNPFLNRAIDLPPVDALVRHHPEDNHPWDGYYLHKAVLSADPSSSPDNFVVMSIMSRYFGVAFCKAGDTTWTSIGDWHTHWRQGDAFYDIIFFSKTNQFYAVLNSGVVFAIDLLGDDGNPKLTQIAPPISGRLRFLSYLVEDFSSGDLLQVFKNLDAHISTTKGHGFNTGSFTSTVQFTVFKLDTANQNWIEIDNLGENVIFLGNSGSMLLSASDCPGCEPNCIYYTDDDDITSRSNFTYYGLPDDGVYNLKDGLVRPHYSSARSSMIRPRRRSSFATSTHVLPQPIWLEPTLR